MVNKLVSIIIPNWNGEKLLAQCLPSIKRSNFNNYEIILVDNNSVDNSIQLAKSIFNNLKVIKLNRNYGFAKAVNEGIKQSKGEYLFLLNNDVIIEKDCITRLVRVLVQKSEDIVGVTGKILSLSDKNIIDSAGDEINIVGQASSRGKGESKTKESTEEPVFLITAGGSLFRKKTFNKVGLFDDDFFAYYEDVDWCLRAQLSGYKLWYTPKAVMYHEHKATSKRMANYVEYLQFRNQTQVIIKNFPSPLLIKRLRWLKIPLVHLNTILFFAKNNLLKEALLSDLWIVFRLPQLILKKIMIQKNRKVDLNYFDNQMIEKKIKLLFLYF
jgi:GT2 family glycosyltransferase